MWWPEHTADTDSATAHDRTAYVYRSHVHAVYDNDIGAHGAPISAFVRTRLSSRGRHDLTAELSSAAHSQANHDDVKIFTHVRSEATGGRQGLQPPGSRRACQRRSMATPRLRPDTLSHPIYAKGRLAPPPAVTSDNRRGTTISPDLQGPSLRVLSMCSLAAMRPSVGRVPEHTVCTEPARPRLSTQRTLCNHTCVVYTNAFVGAEEFFWA
jgi:hypothetical protein